MWIDDDGTVSSMWVSGSFRLLPWRARWALWTAEPEELDELADDVTALETAVGNAASCRREWPDQSAYRMREIPRELRGGFRGLRDFADVREHLLSFPLALSMQWRRTRCRWPSTSSTPSAAAPAAACSPAVRASRRRGSGSR